MEPVAALLQHNPSLVLVLLLGFPSLTWAAAYARRPSRARKRMAIGAFVVTMVVAGLATLEAVRRGGVWWPPVLFAGVIAALWLTAILFRRG
jgi:hypothetical protein